MRQTAVGGSLERLMGCCSRELAVATQQHKKIRNRKTISIHTREPSAMATSPMKKRLSLNACCSQGGCFYLFLVRAQNTCGRENYVRVRACTLVSPTKGKKRLRLKSSVWIHVNSRHLSSNLKYGFWLQIPSSISKWYGRVAETPIRAPAR